MSDWHVAQVNIGRIVAPADSPELAPFMAALDAVNALADTAEGFVWRLQGDNGNATDILLTADPLLLINMSVWQSVEALFQFVYRSQHARFMLRRREWFERPQAAYQALWWVPAGHLPTTAEALSRLTCLQENGPTPEAFTFRERYPAPAETGNGAKELHPTVAA